MRLLFIICESSVDAHVVRILEHAQAPGYTRFTGAIGEGRHGRREGTPIWPGLNSLIMACVPEEEVARIREGLEELEAERSGRLAIKVFSVPADEYC